MVVSGSGISSQSVPVSSVASNAVHGINGSPRSYSLNEALSSVDWRPLVNSMKSAFGDLSSSALKAEKEATAAANAFTEKMWNKTADYNSAQADKANAFTEYLQRQAQDYNTEMSNTYYQRLVEDLRKAGLNPALAVQGLTGQSATSGSGSGQSASMSSSSSAKSNSASALSVQERLIGTLLSNAVSLLMERETNSTKLENQIISGIFSLVGAVLPRTSSSTSTSTSTSTSSSSSTNYNYNTRVR